MVELKKQELFDIQGGAFPSTFPNFQLYGKIFKWIYKTIRSWF